MQSKIGKILFLSLAVLSLGEAVQASGLRGGGETVVVDGRPRLRELVDRSSTCFWQPLVVLMQSVPTTEAILNALREDHWYLAGVYEREATWLKVCFTANISPIPENDWEGITVGFYRRNQVAVRINEMIFLDETIFSKMPEKDKALLILHEITHSLIPLQALDRSTKVRSVTKVIGDHFEKRLSRKVLALNLRMNEITVSSSFTELDENRRLIEQVLDESLDSSLRLKAFARLGLHKMHALLWTGDLGFVFSFTDPYYLAAEEAVRGAEEAALRDLLKEGVSGVLPYFEGKSLLSIAREVSTPNIIRILLEQANQSTSESQSGAEELLIDLITERINAIELESIFALNPNPNFLLRYYDQMARQERLMTLLSFAVLKNRTVIAQRLGRMATLRPETVREAAVYGAGALSRDMNHMVLGWIDSGKMEVHSRLSRGLDLVTESLEAGNIPLFQEMIARGASVEELLVRAASRVDRNEFIEQLLKMQEVDVNAKDREGRTAFELAIANNNKAGASMIARARGFIFEFQADEDPVVTHENAKRILEQFCELNTVAAVEKLLKSYRFGFFDLFPHIERARMRGHSELEKTLKNAIRK